MDYDLLKDVEYGGCSAKLSPASLEEALRGLPKQKHPALLVDISTHDDAGVYKISDDTALIQTTDFFPPLCSDPYDFGQIAAANALSDVYAMGGIALTALNIVMFPSEKIPLTVLREILRGGADKVKEADALIVGGHTVQDSSVKYGLSVTGVVHPERIIANSNAVSGEVIALTKPLGVSTILAGRKIKMADDASYMKALASMKQLNMKAAELMQKYNIRSATDITGFGLLGHALKMAKAGNVTIQIESAEVPLLKQAYELTELGCIPGASFRNLQFVENDVLFNPSLDYNLKMLFLGAETSGGLFITGPFDKINLLVKELKICGYPETSVIGSVTDKQESCLIVN